MIFTTPKLINAVPNPRFIAFTPDTVDGASFTFSGASIGPAQANRRVYVGVAWRSAAGSPRTLSSLTVAGNATTIAAQVNGAVNSSGAALASLALASGTTGDIVVTLSGPALRCAIGVFVSYGHATTATDTATANEGVTNDVSVDVPLGGIIIGMAYNGTATATWTGLTEYFDDIVEGTTRASGAFYAAGAAETPRTITMAPASGADSAVVAASFARL